MPGRKQRPPALPRGRDQRIEFTQRGTRGLFEQHVLAGLQRSRRQRAPYLGRCAERYGVYVRCFR